MANVRELVPRPAAVLAALAVLAAPAAAQRAAGPADWPMAARDYANTRFSPLDQITAENVAGLRPAWTFAIRVVGTVPETQLWQLTAYVRSLAGLAPKDAAPGRTDHLRAAPPENERSPEPPVVAPPPDAGDKPK